MKKEIVEDMKKEEKKKIQFEDFSLKAPVITGDEAKKREQLIIDQIKRGELVSEVINGELKLQFEEGVDLL
jgi:hypothetical protein